MGVNKHKQTLADFVYASLEIIQEEETLLEEGCFLQTVAEVEQFHSVVLKWPKAKIRG